MAYNYEYPYVDPSTYNDDWFLTKFQELISQWQQIQEDWTNQQTAFNELKSYIENYFNNLDLNKEVSDKINSMIESGEFQEILISAVNELAFSNYGITVKEYRFDNNSAVNTSYYITHIPRNWKGTVNTIKLGYTNGIPFSGTQKTTDFSFYQKTPLAVNGGIFNTSNGLPQAPVFIYENKEITGGVIYVGESKRDTLCLKNGILSRYPNVSIPTAEQLIAEGVDYTVCGFWCLVENGNFINHEDIPDWNVENSALYQRQMIGQTPSGDIYFLTCDGKYESPNRNWGMNMHDCAVILNSIFNCTFVYMLDGGGSTSLSYYNTLYNTPSDNNFETERSVPDFLYVENNKASISDRDNSVTHLLNKVNHEAKRAYARVLRGSVKMNDVMAFYNENNNPAIRFEMYYDTSHAVPETAGLTAGFKMDEMYVRNNTRTNSNPFILDISQSLPENIFTLLYKNVFAMPRYTPLNNSSNTDNVINIDTYTDPFFRFFYAGDSGNPFPSNNAIIIQIPIQYSTALTLGGIQIAFPFSNSTDLHPKFRFRLGAPYTNNWRNF